MRAGPMLLEFLAHALGDQMNRQAGGIGGDDRAGLAELRHAGKQVALDVEIFGDDFDDPVGVFATRQVVFKIADGDFFRQRGGKKSGGLGFLCGIETGTHDFVAIFLGAGLLARRHDVQQQHRQAGVGKMRGDARAHRACAKHHGFFDTTFHGGLFTDWYERTGYKTNIHGSIELTQTE